MYVALPDTHPTSFRPLSGDTLWRGVARGLRAAWLQEWVQGGPA